MLAGVFKVHHPNIPKSIFVSPYLLALPIALVIILLIPDLFPKYVAKLESSGLVDKKGCLEFYDDIDHDGASERIIYFNNTRNQASVKIIEDDGQIGDHFYFPGKIIPQATSVSFGEKSPGNGKLICVYSLSGDSLLLNILDYKLKGESRVTTIFIDSISGEKNCFDFVIQQSWFADMDHDSLNEFIGGILSGFALQPRHWFIYDLDNSTLVFSPPMGVWFGISAIEDINLDGEKEIITSTYSISNYPDSLASRFDDHSAWIMVFDHEFKFLFPPGQFRGKYIHVITLPVLMDSEWRLAALVYQTAPGNVNSSLILMDMGGKKILERQLPGRGITYQLYIPDQNSSILYLTNNGGVVERIGKDLQTIWKKKVADKVLINLLHEDLDGDGKEEHFCETGTLADFVIFRDDYSNPVLLDLPVVKSSTNYGTMITRGKHHQIFIQQDNRYYLFTYEKNPVFYLKYLFYAGIYLTIFSIILLSQFTQRKLFRQRYEAEQKISALQLDFFKNQFDPHFTFNALNLVGISIKKNDPETAYRNILRLASLIRSSISSSGNLSRTLAEELNFTTSYLELIKVSMEDKLQFEIKIAHEVDLNTLIPRMVIQIHAENAVKHGIRPRPEGGRVLIDVSCSDDRLIIITEDNGIGRKQAATLHDGSTGKGIEMMDNFFRLFNKFNKQKILYTIEDLFTENNEPAGTKVVISIPLKYNYRLFENK